MELVKVALRVVFNRQYRDGTFRKGESIVRGSTGSRDIGNSYVHTLKELIELIELIKLLWDISLRHGYHIEG